jgi:hypothetical protein
MWNYNNFYPLFTVYLPERNTYYSYMTYQV